MSSSYDKPHPRELELRWTGKGTPTPLSQKMVIGGVKGSKWRPHQLVSGVLMQQAGQRLHIIYILMSLFRHRKF